MACLLNVIIIAPSVVSSSGMHFGYRHRTLKPWNPQPLCIGAHFVFANALTVRISFIFDFHQEINRGDTSLTGPLPQPQGSATGIVTQW